MPDVHPAWDRTLPLWLVTHYGPQVINERLDAAYVHAPDAQTAAEYAAWPLGDAMDEAEGCDREDLKSVHVIGVNPVVEREAYNVGWEPRASRCPDELQCCGGGGYDGGHSGSCPNRPKAVEGA